MKKFVLIMCLSLSVFFFGCKDNLNLVIQENLSEVRYNYFCSNNEKINVKLTSGFREDPYILNGISENKKEFGVITAKFLVNIENKNVSPSFVITINGMDFDGSFELNPFDQTYVEDIETFVLNDAIIFIKITWNDFIFESELKSVTNNFNINKTKI